MQANRYLTILGVLGGCYSGMIMSAEIAADISATEANPSWHQIEIVVFAIEKPTENTEHLAMTERIYPANMVSIAPYYDADLSPHSPRQLEQIQRHNQLLRESRMTSDTEVEINGVLPFANLENHQSTPQPTDRPGSLHAIDTATAKQNDPLDLSILFTRQQPEAFQTVANNERNLHAIVRSINQSSLYRLLLHLAWRQPVLNNEQAIPVLLQGGKLYDELYELEGTFTVSHARYLHVTSDLWLTEFMPDFSQPGRPPLPNWSEEIVQQYPKVITWYAHRRNSIPVHSYQLRQSRKMQSSTLHFFDHPYFGLLVSIKNYDQPTVQH